MNYTIFIIVHILFATCSKGQYCNCNEQALFVINYVEANNPAYQQLKGNKKDFKKYTTAKSHLIHQSRSIKNVAGCLDLLKQYVALVKDHHSNIYALETISKPGEIATEIKKVLPYEYKFVSDSINYVRVSSFNGKLKKELDIFYDSIFTTLISKPYLVLDLRDNGGGNDECFIPLMRYIYTQPIKVDRCDVWVSEENLRLYSKNYATNNALLEKMKISKLNSFVPISENSVWKIDNPTNYPCKVFILQNKSVASSAEDLVNYAKQSNKVITIGQNTGGYMGYGNVISVKTPNHMFQLQTTTTKYKFGSQYEYVGIPPDILLDKFSKWEETVSKLIKQEKKCK